MNRDLTDHLARGRMAALLAGAALCALASAASAQAADTTEVEEVLVTAQKRTERLIDVPVAVSAVSGDTLAAKNINDTASLVRTVPSLTFQQAGTANSSFRIRGIGTSLFGQGVEPSVSFVVDGVVLARPAQSLTDFADLERIEVLRGPQGTLFGKNATAGVVQMITARPRHEFGGSADLTIASHEEYRVKGSVTGPITDNLAGRISAYYNDIGGYITNVRTGADEGGYESFGVRGKLEWDPSDELNLLLTADYRMFVGTVGRPILVSTPNPTLAQLIGPVVASPGNRSIVSDVETLSKTNQAMVSLEANYDLGWGTLTALSAYQQYNEHGQIDVDGLYTPQPIYLGPQPSNTNSRFSINDGPIDIGNFSQEIRVANNPGQRLTYVAGLYYSNVLIHRDFKRAIDTCAGTGLVLGQPCATYVTRSGYHSAKLKSEHISAFGQAEFELVENLKLIAGGRLQREEVTVRGNRPGLPLKPGDLNLQGPTGTWSVGSRTHDDTALTGKVGLQYRFSPDLQTYATYSRGYKGLGLSTELTDDFVNGPPVMPEHVDAYEAGLKGRLPEARLNFSLAVFYAKYTDLQIQANRSDPTTGVIQYVQTNAGSSTTKGVELEGDWRPSENFSITGSVTYTKASIDVDGLNCPLQFQLNAPVLTGDFPTNACYRARLPNAAGVLVTSNPVQDIRGGSLPSTPEWRLSLSPRYEREIGATDWSGFVQVDVNYQSEQQFAVEQDPLLVQDAYTLVNLTIGARNLANGLSVSLFARNLFDENYFTNMAHVGTLGSPQFPNDVTAYIPRDAERIVGITLGAKF
ncbi:TonB-dependent receptor [Phenylobacterium sp.]|uniref:TonB-dependent receptor n=1 Tax=Phenylobacterium sp. TaxID=1871053 RepID=UPI002898127B|nr:TonB-dependent receptor [Phenylobacterium sp.]